MSNPSSVQVTRALDETHRRSRQGLRLLAGPSHCSCLQVASLLANALESYREDRQGVLVDLPALRCEHSIRRGVCRDRGRSSKLPVIMRRWGRSLVRVRPGLTGPRSRSPLNTHWEVRSRQSSTRSTLLSSMQDDVHSLHLLGPAACLSLTAHLGGPDYLGVRIAIAIWG